MISKPFVHIVAVAGAIVQGQVVFRECAMGGHIQGLGDRKMALN